MGLKSPSKFTPLKKLKEIFENDCLGIDQSNEYAPCELEAMIIDKESKLIDKENKRLLKELDKATKKTGKNKMIKNVDLETLKQFKILSIQRNEIEANTFRFLLEFYLDTEGFNFESEV